MIGKQILNYEIKSLIGEGGMGNVYLGEHANIGRKVAIKVLRPELSNNEDIRKRFKNEAKVMASLQHQGIVALYDYHEDENGLYLIMEYVEGEELSEQINQLNHPMDIDHAKLIMRQILEAFSYAHKNGVIHRDVKPANILVSKNGYVKVLDFGIAKIVGNEQFSLTKTGTQIGTVYYMSPEQVKAKELDQRSDIYSLGVTFYELLAGYCPYKSMTSEYEVYDKIVRDPLLPLTDTMGSEYRHVWNVISKATQKDPDQRYATCTEFIEALMKEEESIPPVIPPMGGGGTNLEVTTITQTEPDKEKNKTALIVIGIVAVLLLGTVGYFIVQNGGSGEETGGGEGQITEVGFDEGEYGGDEGGIGGGDSDPVETSRDLYDLTQSELSYTLSKSGKIYPSESFSLNIQPSGQLEDYFEYNLRCSDCGSVNKTSENNYTFTINRTGRFQVEVLLTDTRNGEMRSLGNQSFESENKILNSTPEDAMRLWLSNISNRTGYNLQTKWTYSDYMNGYGTTYKTDVTSVEVLRNDGRTADVRVVYKSFDSQNNDLKLIQKFHFTNYGSSGWKWGSITNEKVEVI